MASCGHGQFDVQRWSVAAGNDCCARKLASHMMIGNLAHISWPWQCGLHLVTDPKVAASRTGTHTDLLLTAHYGAFTYCTISYQQPRSGQTREWMQPSQRRIQRGWGGTSLNSADYWFFHTSTRSNIRVRHCRQNNVWRLWQILEALFVPTPTSRHRRSQEALSPRKS